MGEAEFTLGVLITHEEAHWEQDRVQGKGEKGNESSKHM